MWRRAAPCSRVSLTSGGAIVRTARTFRIFVSSTFSDLKEERNALQQHVFPRLRELSLQHGCRFQAIDLRWGVREEAGLDQQTMRICLDEVSRSQRASPRPNFIVLLGDRYGWRPLPSEIPGREFTPIRAATTDAADRQLLDEWYKRDDNALGTRRGSAEPEPAYCLQPRTDRFADSRTGAWEAEVERPLRAILRRGLDGLELTEDERRKYEASATEQEIAAGALQVADASEHVFCFLRTMSGVPADASAVDFIDVDEHGLVDRDAVARLARLKGDASGAAGQSGVLDCRLPGNIHRYSAQWTGSGTSTDHIGSLPADLEACRALIGDAAAPATLCVDVWKRLASVIEDECRRLGQIDPLDKEADDHRAFATDRSRLFVGRRVMLDTIAAYLASSDPHPLAVWGPSGSGKSALMASAMAHGESRHPRARIVSRFIGATAASSDVRALLESVCRQITRLYGGDEAAIPSDYQELVKAFGKRLMLATPEHPLIVFFDALDQLSDADHARDLTWLPVELPAHVRLVVSTLPGECKTVLERKAPSSLVALEPMPNEEASALLDAWLTEAGRTLQPAQRQEVLAKFARSASASDGEGTAPAGGMPLYLKLAFEEARRWQSYSPGVELAPTIPGLIHQLFGRLSSDTNHGTVMVSRSLGYLAAARHGLTEDEMLDLLWLDEAVRADFKARRKHTPPEDRLPVVVWSRLYSDLEPYLTERSADGVSLLGFYHRQLREVAEAKFLSGAEKPARHAHIADYFARQDLFEPQTKSPNVRKLSELPYQQTYGEQWDLVRATLTDFEFLEAKLTHVATTASGRGERAHTIYGGLYELREDYRRALEKLPPD